MFIREKCYDIEEIMRNNLHIHPNMLSYCSKDEMRLKSIIPLADELGLERIAFTEHYYGTDNTCPLLESIAIQKWIVDGYFPTKHKVDILYGAELICYGIGKWADTDELNSKLDYRLYAVNHYSQPEWEHPEDKTPRGYAEHNLKCIEELMKSGRADCIAHPLVGQYIPHFSKEEKLAVTESITDNELGDILSLARDTNTAWEINRVAVNSDHNFAKRFWNIGKEVGVVFHYGSDAHFLNGLYYKELLEWFKKLFK